MFYYIKKIISGYERGKELFKIEKQRIRDSDDESRGNYTSPKAV